jgi:NTP pyrophosphatase (non-canonical NTP hydrolase)
MKTGLDDANHANNVKLSELMELVREFCEARNWDSYHSLKNLAIGAVTEAAELVEPYRFLNDQESDAFAKTPKGRENLEDELADVLFFLLRIAQRYDVDLGEAFRRKIQKNAIKYPLPLK